MWLTKMCAMYDLFYTKQGWIGIVASAKGIKKLILASSKQAVLREFPGFINTARYDHLQLAYIRSTIQEYCRSGAIDLRHIPLDYGDTSKVFQRIWDICRSIPIGETRSYGWIAKELGIPRAYRLVGQAMARNPFVILVPCHRVISANGGLGGYQSGPEMKQQLLQLERR